MQGSLARKGSGLFLSNQSSSSEGPTIVRDDSSTREDTLKRLQRRGCRSLSDIELVSTLLRSGGCSEDTALEMAREVLGNSGLASLLRLEEGQLLAKRGFGKAKTTRVLAAVELGQRLARIRMPKRRLMERPDQVAGYLWMRYCQKGREVAGALYLDVRQRLIEERELTRGTLRRVAIDTRMFVKPALDCGAAQMIIFHTHPSGCPIPSTDDLSFTYRLVQAAEIFGIQLIDHLILGSCRQYVSLHKRAPWRGKP